MNSVGWGVWDVECGMKRMWPVDGRCRKGIMDYPVPIIDYPVPNYRVP